jgi:NMD protein affecting ribosome stability and mRNA decay
MNRINYCMRCGAKLHLHNTEGFCSKCLAEAAIKALKEDTDSEG